MILIGAIFLVSLFFSLNIGASGASASMGIAYSSQAISKKMSIFLSAAGLILGAVFGGATVIKTLSHGLVPETDFTLKITLMILIAATATLFIANLLGIPLSTSEVTVGAIVGLGMVTHHVFVGKLGMIVLFWLLMPGLSFFLAFGLKKALNRLNKYEKPENRWLILLVIGLGVVEAFSAGMNNVANSMGPLVSAHLISMKNAVIFGGLFLGIGALTLGWRTLETNGKKIISLTLLEGGFISGMVSVLVILASLIGIPIPMAQMTTCAIMGVGTGKEGFGLYRKAMVRKILTIWFVSPLASLVISFALIKGIVHADIYTLLVMAGVSVSTLGFTRLKHFKRERTALPTQKEF